MQMLGTTLSIHNNEICYICVLKQSIFIPIYYDQRFHCTRNKAIQPRHKWPITSTLALRSRKPYLRSRNVQIHPLDVDMKPQEISILETSQFVLISKHKVWNSICY